MRSPSAATAPSPESAAALNNILRFNQSDTIAQDRYAAALCSLKSLFAQPQIPIRNELCIASGSHITSRTSFCASSYEEKQKAFIEKL
jgi:hypothetical protein